MVFTAHWLQRVWECPKYRSQSLWALIPGRLPVYGGHGRHQSLCLRGRQHCGGTWRQRFHVRSHPESCMAFIATILNQNFCYFLLLFLHIYIYFFVACLCLPFPRASQALATRSHMFTLQSIKVTLTVKSDTCPERLRDLPMACLVCMCVKSLQVS